MFRILAMLPAFIPAFFLQSYAQAPQFSEKIEFPSFDDIIITADLYLVSDSLPYMILCHQAGWSRGEYMETAGKFCRLGFNCLAIDQRSGKEVNGVKNETAALAAKKKKPTSYLDAEQDILASVNYAYEKSGKKVFLVGSSYSASLVLKIASSNKKIRGVLAFSPGEYFGKKLNLKESISGLSVPVFAASAKEESAEITQLLSEVKSKIKNQFTPVSAGRHGASALWKETPGNHEYWLAILMFMKQAVGKQ